MSHIPLTIIFELSAALNVLHVPVLELYVSLLFSGIAFFQHIHQLYYLNPLPIRSLPSSQSI